MFVKNKSGKDFPSKLRINLEQKRKLIPFFWKPAAGPKRNILNLQQVTEDTIFGLQIAFEYLGEDGGKNDQKKNYPFYFFPSDF